MAGGADYSRRGSSRSPDPRLAVRQLHEQIALPDAALTLFFCSPDYDLEILGAELRECFGETPLIGCTSSGEVGPGGYQHGSIVGATLSRSYVTAAVVAFDRVSRFEMSDGADLAQALLHHLRKRAPEAGPANTFAMLLIDGLSAREEIVASAVHLNLHGVPMFGGSASDEYRLKETHVYHDGTFRSDRFVLAAVHTTHPFQVFRHQHFVSTGVPLVVTSADTPRRIVRELNGRPAAEEYARALGRAYRTGEPAQFSGDPMIVRVEGQDYLRSPMECLEDGSVRFACAIAEGLVFSPGRSIGLRPALETQVADLRAQLGQPELLIACDCLGRWVETEARGEVDEVGAILDEANAIGLATYGEQINSMHVNQTLTGVALGRRSDA